jgi:hypothetical protein
VWRMCASCAATRRPARRDRRDLAAAAQAVIGRWPGTAGLLYASAECSCPGAKCGRSRQRSPDCCWSVFRFRPGCTRRSRKGAPLASVLASVTLAGSAVLGARLMRPGAGPGASACRQDPGPSWSTTSRPAWLREPFRTGPAPRLSSGDAATDDPALARTRSSRERGRAGYSGSPGRPVSASAAA